jgi:MoaA/NifB/PqqE/SkfB family radical SAM enzyme
MVWSVVDILNMQSKYLAKIWRKIFQTFMKVKKSLSPLAYEFVAADITSNCNLRCTFCINDFSRIKGNTLMGEATFEKLLTLIPLVNGCNFFISCLFEPAIHPSFISFLEKIPPKYRNKVYFTTNLSTKIRRQDLQRLSRVNVHHINISIDSLQRETFEKLRQKANFEVFIDNLRCLAEVFSRAAHPPRIRFTTMALKPNLHEIPNLVETCAQKYLAYTHEIRHVYPVPHLSSQWKQDNLISNHDWQELRVFAEETPYNCELVPPPPVYYPGDHQSYSRQPTGISANGPASAANSLPFGLNVKSDGTVSLYGKPEIQYKLDALEEPGKFFKTQMNHFQAIIRGGSF